MTQEQALVLSVLRSQLQEKPIGALPELGSIDWPNLIREIHVHAVSLLFFNGIVGLQDRIPEKYYTQCSVLARRTTARNLRNEYLQSLLVCQLEQLQCPYVILKGEAAAAYYPDPTLRQLGDVDFMVPPQNAEAVIATFKQQGFAHSCEEKEYHQILKKGSNWMELHFEPAGVPEGSSGELVRDYLSSVFEQRQLVSGASGMYFLPQSAHHGLILLLHMQHHMTELGLGLRHLVDWACFVQKTQAQPFWEESLLPLLKKIGLFHYTAVVTKLCALHLHSPCPQWASYPEDALCHALMEDVLACGSFGKKDTARSRSSNMLPDLTKEQASGGKLSLLYATLRDSVLKSHPELANRPVSRFFAMAWKVCRYLLLCCLGKRPNLIKVASLAQSRDAVYQQLHIFEPEQPS